MRLPSRDLLAILPTPPWKLRETTGGTYFQRVMVDRTGVSSFNKFPTRHAIPRNFLAMVVQRGRLTGAKKRQRRAVERATRALMRGQT